MSAQVQTTEKAKAESLLSLRQAAKVLGVNRYWLSGYVVGLGIDLVSLGPSIGIRRSDLEKIKLKLESREQKAS